MAKLSAILTVLVVVGLTQGQRIRRDEYENRGSFNPSGGQSGYDPSGGQSGFNPSSGGQSGFNPSSGGQSGFNPSSGGQSGYNPSSGGQSGFNPSSGGQSGFNPSSGGQSGFNPSSGGQSGYDPNEGHSGGQSGYNPTGGHVQAGYFPREGVHSNGGQGGVTPTPSILSITCYKCLGKLEVEAEGLRNNEYCTFEGIRTMEKDVEKFSMKLPDYWKGEKSLACITVSLQDKDWNMGKSYVMRQPFEYDLESLQRSTNALKEELLSFAVGYRGTAEPLVHVCTENLCNGSSSASGVSAGVVTLGIAFFLATIAGVQ